ncbi:DUF1758 domain-containing protein [Trichonephila clavipes]|nr:DUF1758 domain-containing protein [Trichonephila clavipes]
MQISNKFSRLEKCQSGISNIILKEETNELAYEEDFMKAEIYRDRFSEHCTKRERLSVKETEKKVVPEKIKFKLPKIELKKFDVDNYPKAIVQLQGRFGREHLLVQIYLKDLMSMVMRNAATGRSKTDLPALYDELEAKIRALESLGRTQDKYGEFLSSLVESCLPDDIRIVAFLVTSSSPVPLKTRHVGQRCTLNLSRAEMSSRWCSVVVRRGGVSSGVVHVTSPWFKITWSVAKSPRIAEQCDINIQSISQPR